MDGFSCIAANCFVLLGLIDCPNPKLDSIIVQERSLDFPDSFSCDLRLKKLDSGFSPIRGMIDNGRFGFNWVSRVQLLRRICFQYLQRMRIRVLPRSRFWHWEHLSSVHAIWHRGQILNLIIGTGRCGTGYASKFLKSCGVDCRHEKMGGTWLSSWHSASMLLPYGPFKLKDCSESVDIEPVEKVVHLFRHPIEVCSSWIVCKPRAFEFSRFCLNGYTGSVSKDWVELEDRVEWAMYHYLHWNRLCERFGGDKVHIEYLDTYFGKNMGLSPPKKIGRTNSYRKNPDYKRFTTVDFAKVNRKLWLACSDLYNEYCNGA